MPGLEPAVRTLAAQQGKTYKTLADVPPIRYIRTGDPQAKVPRIKGKREEEALVPDTLNLEELARLVVNHMTGIACLEKDGEIYYQPDLQAVPPRYSLSAGSGQLWPKYMEALPLMRLMSGSTQGLEVDKKWAEVILKSIGPDGLYYLPLAGRPLGPAQGVRLARPRPLPRRDPRPRRADLGVLKLYYLLTGDKIWLEAGRRMVDGLARLTQNVEDKAIIFGTYYFPGDRPPADAEKIAAEQIKKAGLFSWDNSLYTTWMVTGLAQFYQVVALRAGAGAGLSSWPGRWRRSIRPTANGLAINIAGRWRFRLFASWLRPRATAPWLSWDAKHMNGPRITTRWARCRRWATSR